MDATYDAKHLENQISGEDEAGHAKYRYRGRQMEIRSPSQPCGTALASGPARQIR
jgi:hypothetical protein